MKLQGRKLESAFAAMEPAELVGVYVRLAAAGDAAGLEALHRVVPRSAYAMADAAFVDPLERADRAVDRFAMALHAADAERRALLAGGRIAADTLRGMGATSHGESDAAALEQHSPSAWWEARGLELPHRELVARYELATLAAVAAWQAFDRYCADQLNADGRTTLAAHLQPSGLAVLLEVLDRVLDDYACASDARWVDALEQHRPPWVTHPEHADAAHENAVALFAGLAEVAA